MKRCYRCKKELHINSFRKNNRSNDGFSASCKECLNELGAENRKRRREMLITLAEKTCKRCLFKKSAKEFGLNSDTKDGLHRNCRSCMQKMELTFSERKRKREQKGYTQPPDKKVCSACGQEKPIYDFCSKLTAPTGFSGICKACKRSQLSRLRKQNPNYTLVARNNQLLSDYGISLEDFNKLSLEQKGFCSICSENLPLVVDHCHKTKKVRGLLCRNCNLGLGYFKDNLERLQKAIDYLKSENRHTIA